MPWILYLLSANTHITKALLTTPSLTNNMNPTLSPTPPSYSSFLDVASLMVINDNNENMLALQPSNTSSIIMLSLRDNKHNHFNADATLNTTISPKTSSPVLLICTLMLVPLSSNSFSYFPHHATSEYPVHSHSIILPEQRYILQVNHKQTYYIHIPENKMVLG